jgi:hypothetical protein
MARPIKRTAVIARQYRNRAEAAQNQSETFKPNCAVAAPPLINGTALERIGDESSKTMFSGFVHGTMW